MSNGPRGISMKKCGGQMSGCRRTKLLPSVLNVKVLVAAFNKEKAFSVIVQLHRLIVYTALRLTLAQPVQGTTVSCLQLISLWGPAFALSTSHFFSNFKHLSSASAYLLCRFWICQKKISLYNWHYLSYLRFNCMKRRQYHIVVDFIYICWKNWQLCEDKIG